MKQFSLFCGMVLAAAGLFGACGNPAQGDPVFPGSSVWEISKDGNSLFLGGSVHLLRVEDYPMPAAFDSAFDRAAVLVLEADVDKVSDPEIVRYQDEKIKLPEGQTLRTALDAGVYEQLEKTINNPYLLEAVSPYKPAAAISILQMVFLQINKFTQDGADLYYLKKSKAAEKPVDFLEDVKVQIDMLGGMAEGYENEYVSAAIEEFPLYKDQVAALISEWKDGASLLTEASLAAQKSTQPDIYKALIYDRNAAWTAKIEQYLTAAPVEFVITGLAHLYGQDGLLTQLENNGYAVKQLVE
jgi:uncharacterized protein YbaP (TraB family)